MIKTYRIYNYNKYWYISFLLQKK